MGHEYELVPHEIGGFRVFLVNVLYRTPHSHKDLEFGLVLKGQVDLIFGEEHLPVSEASLFLINSFTLHELRASEPCLLLMVQVSPDFFTNYFPQLSSFRFENSAFARDFSTDAAAVFQDCFALAQEYFNEQPLYELSCAAYLNRLLFSLLRLIPHSVITPQEQKLQAVRQNKFRYLTDAIDDRYSGRLLLSDLSEEMHVSLYYLSHFFKENFHMPFQEYLSRVRCEKARQMLLLTDRSLLDISIACGFSDPKYFNRSFREFYGIAPKEYRKDFENAPLPVQQQSMLTTQEFLSKEASLVLLNRYLES